MCGSILFCANEWAMLNRNISVKKQYFKLLNVYLNWIISFTEQYLEPFEWRNCVE